MKRLYADDSLGHNVHRLPVETQPRTPRTVIEQRWDALRTSRQLAVLLLVALAFAAMFERTVK